MTAARPQAAVRRQPADRQGRRRRAGPGLHRRDVRLQRL